ncbi:MAG: peptidylprolyl isomerase [Bacteroidaceae bacterium]|jgi:peptidylprolyl isomerase|nr:peptidylprolyl isomerase [Bacteroidaceae bacterium]
MKYKLLAIILMAATINSCGGASSQNAKAQTAQDETKVLIKTTVGDITIKLYNETPQHRDNFIKLVEEHYYDSILFHRVIKNFMVQAGDPESKNADKGVQLGAGGPGYTVPAEFVYPKYFHKRGALSAARQADQVNPERKSSGSQFYIVTGKTYSKYELQDMEKQLRQKQGQGIFDRLVAQNMDSIMSMQMAGDNDGIMKLQEELNAKTNQIFNEQGPFKFTEEQVDAYMSEGGTPFLDNDYTVFGEVIDGMKAVDKIESAGTDMNDRPRKDIRIISMEIIK